MGIYKRFHYLAYAVESLRFNKMMGGRYTPGAWWSGSLGDHILWLLFPLFDAYEKNGGGDFEVFAREWLSGADWKDQLYLREHVIGIAVRLHEVL